MTKQLRAVLDIIFAGFVVRTREEMKVFENLIGKQSSLYVDRERKCGRVF